MDDLLTNEQIKQIAKHRGFSLVETDKLESLKLKHKEMYQQNGELLAVLFEHDLLNENGEKLLSELIVKGIREAIDRTEIEIEATPELETNSYQGKALICESVCLNHICNEMLTCGIPDVLSLVKDYKNV